MLFSLVRQCQCWWDCESSRPENCVVAADIMLISLPFNLQLLPVFVRHFELRKRQTRLAWVRRNCFVVNYRQCGKTRQKYLSSSLVTWDIIISSLSDAISISGCIPTSSDIAVSTIEKFDLENIGRGLYWWNFYQWCHITQDIQVGVILPPPVGHLKV